MISYQIKKILYCTSDGRWQYDYGLTNIEYTEFDRLGITDQPLEGASGAAQLSVFPANTNVLYVGLQAAEDIVQQVASGLPVSSCM